ncbi:hypothetical protein M8868_02455 [Pasteurella multocida]|uniref:Uncharacterized protein n=1 Tax=Pasteurella multocida TaxID=747 RepID=A0A849CQG2_PASMD|nr:hypothetical protein [Pasteurella multocida]AFF23373.1 hypothetical protein PMCN06_0113 [Pasteurella multocida subsp. multocida str. HN06]AFI45267.1 hypothetical protein NT08PM_0105 [Pasteurella multocida subsp. multocida str. 3480]ARA69592.1 hypothetical protein BTV67_03245 [Pasteurella multocida subsp. multocida]ARA88391.1 hypothetical protein BTV66_01615 [Pasteurella multocida subsp. septica]AXN95904.1 hypothetical protein DYY62_08625 [Pasteurella multocida]
MAYTTFQEWYNEADMPTRAEDGKWYDAETGLPYQPVVKKVVRKSVSSDAKGFRAYAKQFGGVALTGSTKQKEWAEKIRYEILVKCDDEQATAICALALTQKSTFWINFRNESAEQIFNRVCEIRKAIKEVNKARRAYEATADERGFMNKDTAECAAYEAAIKRYYEVAGE